MMTPGGYVYLTSENARLLLSGHGTNAHPGNPEYAAEIVAEELLGQEVCNANFGEGAWNLLSDYIQQPEQAQTPFEQGVTMC